jgi:iron complex transport system substrate-binding protein
MRAASPRTSLLSRKLTVLLAALVVAGLAAGGAASSQRGGVACRDIKHLNGTTCVPERPQRVVALGGLFATDNLIALGIKPVGSAGVEGKQYPFWSFPWIPKRKFSGVEYVGDHVGPWNLEKILALRPDLIILGGFDGGVYDQLSRIAPTVVVGTDFLSWRNELLAVGNVVNRRQAAINYIRAHDRKARAYRPMVKRVLKNRTVAVMRFELNNRARGFTQNSYTGSVWYDLRVNFAPGLATREAIKSGVVRLGVEELGRLDADVMFMVTGFLNPDQEFQDAASSTARLFRGNPLWRTLKAVKNGRVFSLPRWVTGGGGALYATAALDLAAYRIEHNVAAKLR